MRITILALGSTGDVMPCAALGGGQRFSDMNDETFQRLVKEGWEAPFSGWDFSWLQDRYFENLPSWDYRALALERIRRAHSLLDMGTGGGELLSTLAPFPPDACATEGYPPNVPIARARLEPLGVKVIPIDDKVDLPFEDARFDLVTNRHESYSGGELMRILKPGGIFLTQQVGGLNCLRLNELLQERVEFEYIDWRLDNAVRILSDAGLEILQAREEFPEVMYKDVAAVVYYLKTIPWQIEGFEPEKYMDRLAALHTMILRDGGLVVQDHRMLIEARKPTT
jgi:SAM-dependent methyltransferase